MAGCTNSHYTKKCTIKNYRVPKKHLKHYQAFFKTDNVNWEYARICSEHWSKPRVDRDHLPDIRLPAEKVSARKTRETRYQRAEKRNKVIKVCRKQKESHRKEEEKIANEKANEICALQKQVLDLQRDNKKLKHENVNLTATVDQLNARIEEMNTERQVVERKLSELKQECEKSAKFMWSNLPPKTFRYLTGLDTEEFKTLFALFLPYLHLIKYEGCSRPFAFGRKLSKENELFSMLIILRHGVEEGIVAWITGVSPSTMSRIFVAWVVFGSAIFSKLDISHPKDLIQEKMPQCFTDLGYRNVVLILDATEIKVTNLSNLSLNCLFFSDYKNTHTAKGIVGITPYGALCHLPDLYPGSVNDTTATSLTNALHNVHQGDCVLIDKGFCIAEDAAEKGAMVNRPPTANVDQFTPGECEANFQIAALRIHVERWIGRMRDFAILNSVWHVDRLDLLNEAWRFIGHLVNLISVIGPKEK